MYKIEIGGDASGFNAAAEGAKRSAQALEKALATTSKSGNPTKKALREVTNEAARLGAQLATMSAEQKRGAIGRQLQRDYEVAKQAAAQLTD